jgi:hypothetical protein
MKKQIIGFDRELELDWLDLTAGLAQQGLFLEQIRQELQRQLAGEIPGVEACRKTITLLTRLWVRIPSEHLALQIEALALLSTVLPHERLWLHWGMSMLAYPFFFDVASVMGRLLRLQEEVEATQVQRRTREDWGERTTLERAVSRLLKTFVAWQVTRETSPGSYVYRATPPHQTKNISLSHWFTECLIWGNCQTKGQSEQLIPLSELTQSPAIFPFDLTSHIATLRQSNRFEISRQGLDLEMVALA